MRSQIETSEKIEELVRVFSKPIGVVDLIRLRDLMMAKIVKRPYDETTKEHEKSIRWKRTAGQILEDGYVYTGKACTDLTVLFIALCHALGLSTSFVKVKDGGKVHSVAEIKLDHGWYFFDVSNQDTKPIKGQISEERSFGEWKLWKKGRDAWDIGLTDFDTIAKIK